MPRSRLLVFVALLSVGASASAQWLNYPTPGTPRTKDGKPDLAAPAPRTANGKPDLSGVWHVEPTGVPEMKRIFGDRSGALSVPGMGIDTVSKYGINILVDFKPEESPMRAGATDIFRRRAGSNLPSGSCLPGGIPFELLVSTPDRIVQSSGMIAMLLESSGMYRQMYTDGLELPEEVAQPSWYGYSVAKWEGDTLVVQTAGFNDKTWLDYIGHPHSEATAGYRRRDFGHMDVEMTLDDPQMYTKPIIITITQELLADSDIFETVCNENEKDRAHIGQK
jgi:hypothetical protein